MLLQHSCTALVAQPIAFKVYVLHLSSVSIVYTCFGCPTDAVVVSFFDNFAPYTTIKLIESQLREITIFRTDLQLQNI